jgi:hypothetical protein
MNSLEYDSLRSVAFLFDILREILHKMRVQINWEHFKKFSGLDLPCKKEVPPVTCSVDINDPFEPSVTLKYCSPMQSNDEIVGSSSDQINSCLPFTEPLFRPQSD